MAIKFEKTQIKGGFPVFWRGECEVLPGDFKLKGTYPEGMKLKEGTPIKIDFENMECTICKSARIVEGGTTTKPRVVKGSMFQANDAVKIGESTGTIKSISTTNESYDEITLNAAMAEAIAGADLLGGDEMLLLRPPKNTPRQTDSPLCRRHMGPESLRTWHIRCPMRGCKATA